MLAVGDFRGVPLVAAGAERVGGHVEGSVVEVQLAGGITHAEDRRRIDEVRRTQGATVGQHEADVADLEVVVVLVEVDFRGCLGACPDADRRTLALREVALVDGERQGRPSRGATVEDAEDILTDSDAVLEVGVDAVGLEDEDRLVLQRSDEFRGDVGAVDAELRASSIGFGPDDDGLGAGDELALFDVEANRIGVRALDSNAHPLGGGLIDSVGRGDLVLVPALADEIGGRNRVFVDVALAANEVVGAHGAVGAVAELDRRGADELVVDDRVLDAEVGIGRDRCCSGLINDMCSSTTSNRANMWPGG